MEFLLHIILYIATTLGGKYYFSQYIEEEIGLEVRSAQLGRGG